MFNLFNSGKVEDFCMWKKKLWQTLSAPQQSEKTVKQSCGDNSNIESSCSGNCQCTKPEDAEDEFDEEVNILI